MQPQNFHRTFSGQDLSTNRIKTLDQYVDCDTSSGPVDVYLPAINAFGGNIDLIRYIFTDIGENAATNNIRIFPCPETDDTIEGEVSLTLSDNGKVLSLTIGANRNWNIDGSATSNGTTTTIWVDTTYSALLSLRNSSGLTKGVTYYMTDKKIALQAIATDQLSLEGKMIADVPDYSTYSLWDYAATYSAGEFAVYRNRVYQATAATPTVGTVPPNGGQWTVQTNPSYYNVEVHAVEYDMDNEWIVCRADSRNNEVYYSYFNSLMAPTNSNICESFIWGNSSVYGNYVYESYCPLSLMAGSAKFTFANNRIVNSTFYGKTNGTGMMGTFSQNRVENCNIGLIVTKKITWSSCSFANTSITTIAITQSSIQWNNDTFESSSFVALTLNSASASVNNNSYLNADIDTISLYAASITFQHNSFENLSASGSYNNGAVIEGASVNFSNNNFENCSSAYVYVGPAAPACNISNNNFWNCSTMYVQMLYQGARLINNTIKNSSIDNLIVGDSGDSVDTTTVQYCLFDNATISGWIVRSGSNYEKNQFVNLVSSDFLSGEYSTLIDCYFSIRLDTVLLNDSSTYSYFTCKANVIGSGVGAITPAIQNVTIDVPNGASWDMPAFMNLAGTAGGGIVQNQSATQNGTNMAVTINLDDAAVFNAGVLLDNPIVSLGKYAGRIITTATSVKTITSIQTTSMGNNPFTFIPSTNNLSVTYVAVAGATAGQPVRDGGAGTVTYVQRTNGADFVTLQKNGIVVALVASKQYT